MKEGDGDYTSALFHSSAPNSNKLAPKEANTDLIRIKKHSTKFCTTKEVKTIGMGKCTVIFSHISSEKRFCLPGTS